jgi:hypothetical protein
MKTAKEQEQQEIHTSVPSTMETETEILDQAAGVICVPDPAITKSSTTSGSADGNVHFEPDKTQDEGPSSPCRRSSRLTTRLPRLQKPVKTLALKRLNGTGFTSMQKETQSLALATRANTKTNKANALSVHMKLIQLQAESRAGWEEANLIRDENRKRKRKGKEVTWDEMLARSQDGSVVRKSYEEEANEEPKIAAEEITEVPTETIVEPTEQPVVEEVKPLRKVRNLRRLTAGTVNGTPAPKKMTSLPVPVASTFWTEKAKVAEVTEEPVKGKAMAHNVQTRMKTRTAR